MEGIRCVGFLPGQRPRKFLDKLLYGTRIHRAEDAANNVFSDIYGNYWTESNTDAKYPRLTTTEATNNNQSSDFWLVNGRYIRLKNAEFGYTFPKRLIQKMRLSQLRVFVSGTNLLTFAPFKLWDSDLQTGASNYPNTRVANIGLNIGF